MDPNELLRQIREIAQRLLGDDGVTGRSEHAALQQDAADGALLAEKVENLDEWLTKGGFLPDVWERARGV